MANKKTATKETTKTAKATNSANGKQTKPPKGADKKPALRDSFGFGLETKNHKFGEMLRRKGGCTMREVREAAWNSNGAPYYNTFKKLLAKGFAVKKEGRMYAKHPAGKPAPGAH